jgi:beta-N-acetylhexosaminidase
MTAHVIYTALDHRRPATTSKTAIRFIRKDLGFGGLIMSDDLSMKALGGAFDDRARKAIAAGCDVALHCNGDMTEMKAVAAGCGELVGKSKSRAAAALARLAKSPEPFDLEEGRARFQAAFG